MVVLALVSALLFGGPANAQHHYKVVDTGKFTPYWVAGDGHSAWGGYQSGVNRQPALFDLHTQMVQPVNQYMDLEAATSKAMYVSSGITRNGRYTYTAFRVDVKSGQLQIVGPDVRFVLAITASEDGSVAGYFSLDNTSNEAPWLQESNGTVHSLPLGSSGIDGNPYAINKQWVAGDIRSLLPSGDSLY